MSTNATVAVAAAPRPAWLQSPVWDGFWILSGLWLLGVLLIARSAGLPDLNQAPAVACTILLWGGHIASPMITAWGHPVFRSAIAAQRARYIYVPAAIVIASVAFGVLGDLSQWTANTWARHVNPRYVLFYTFLLWNTWHFSSQHFGVLSIYRRLAGQTSPEDRRADRWFSVLAACVLLPLAWYSNSVEFRLGPLLGYLGPARHAEFLTTTVIVAGVALTGWMLAREARIANGTLPRALYILAIGLQPIFGAVSYFVFHFFLYTVSHWMIALALSSRIIANRHRQASPAAMSIRDLPANSRFAAAFGGFAVISILLYWILFRPADVFGPFDGGIHNGFARGTTSYVLGALSGAYFGITFVHFMYDRFVYSFRRPEVRESVGAYLFQRAK